MHKPIRGVSVSRAHPLARGLVGCWLLNEGTGELAFDLSGSGGHGQLVNLDPATDWVGGQCGWALECLAASSQHIDAPPGADLAFPTDSYTILVRAVWDGTDAWGYLGGIDDTSALNFGVFQLYHRNNGLIQFRAHYTDGTERTASSPSVMVADAWHQVAAVCDLQQQEIVCYLDGVPGSSMAFTGTRPQAQGPLHICARDYQGAAQGFFNGQIECALLWDRVLSREEIAWLDREPYGMFGTPAPIFAMAPSAPVDVLGPTLFGDSTQQIAFNDRAEQVGSRDRTQRLRCTANVS